MRVLYRSFVQILIVLTIGLVSGFASEPSKILNIQVTADPPKIDGDLTDNCWKNVMPVSNFIQYDPVNGNPASEETLVWVLYDRKNIYFAFYMKDSQPDKIWAELTPRNEYDNNDFIEVILDTYNDQRTSVYFQTNPKGVQKNSVETIWQSGAVIQKDGWTAEIAIPFKSLRFSPTKNQIWGINFERYIHRLKETDYWTLVKRDIPRLQQMGELRGMEGIKPSYNLEFFPYMGFRSTRWEDEKDDKMAVGLDLKYGILPNLILDVTASPDFSEVESDPFIYQLSPYENYFGEHRPFFTEGSHYFEENGGGYGRRVSLFYSRRIHSPKIAAKITGKTGDYSFGFLGALNKPDEEEIDAGIGDGTFSVFRIKKDIFRGSQVGIYYAGKKNNLEDNQNFSFDYNFNFKKFYYIKGQHILSLNQNEKNDSRGIHVVEFKREPDNGFQLQLYYKRVDKDADIKTGYLTKTDSQFFDWDIGYAFRYNKGMLKHMEFFLSGNHETDIRGNQVLETLTARAEIELFPNLRLHGWHERGKSRHQIYDAEGDLFWTDTFIDMRLNNIMIDWERGGFLKEIEFRGKFDQKGIYNEEYTSVEPGRQTEIEAEIAFRPWSNFEWSVGGGWTRQVLDATGEEVFNGITYETALHLQLTRNFFLNTRWLGETRDEQYNLDFLAGYYFGAGNMVQLSYKKSAIKIEGFREKGFSITLKVSYLLRV